MSVAQELPDKLLPYMRLAYASTEAEVQRAGAGLQGPSEPVSEAQERALICQLKEYLQQRLSRWVPVRGVRCSTG